MSQSRWNANARGEYWIDVSLGGRALQVLIDTGLIDAKGQVGFSVDEILYDSIKGGKRFCRPPDACTIDSGRSNHAHRKWIFGRAVD